MNQLLEIPEVTYAQDFIGLEVYPKNVLNFHYDFDAHQGIKTNDQKRVFDVFGSDVGILGHPADDIDDSEIDHSQLHSSDAMARSQFALRECFPDELLINHRGGAR